MSWSGSIWWAQEELTSVLFRASKLQGTACADGPFLQVALDRRYRS
jgi:hypothetical protein